MKLCTFIQGILLADDSDGMIIFRKDSTYKIGKHFWINIILTLLGYIPGIVHAVWVIAKKIGCLILSSG
jgi:hypothetical protein